MAAAPSLSIFLVFGLFLQYCYSVSPRVNRPEEGPFPVIWEAFGPKVSCAPRKPITCQPIGLCAYLVSMWLFFKIVHKIHNNVFPYACKMSYKLCTKSHIFTLKKKLKSFTLWEGDGTPPPTPCELGIVEYTHGISCLS